MMVDELAPAFTLAQARAVGLRKDQVYALRDAGQIEKVGHGVYLRPDAIDPVYASLAAATALHKTATLCLTSALVHHDLTDLIPFDSDIALPRGTRVPTGFSHVTWHSFDVATFDVGRDEYGVAARSDVAVYSAERTIVDCFRLKHQEGSELAHEALRRWLRRRGSTPSSLLKLATSFPRTKPRIQEALEVLL